VRTLRRFVPILALLVAVLGPAPEAAAATIVVTKTADTFDGTCDADCSLREAIVLANSSTNADVIVVPAGHYVLTIGGPPEDTGISGDLEVMNSVTFLGAGAGSTIIDAGEEDGLGQRVFEVAAFDTASTFEVTFSDLTVTGGWGVGAFDDSSGGGIMVRGGADVTLADVGIIDNYVSFSGAGLQVDPDSTLTLLRTTVAENATTLNGYGAGIMVDRGQLAVRDSTISHNSAMGNGGGLVVMGSIATAAVRNSTISSNRANASGGGISTEVSATVDLRNVTITNNRADDDSAGTIGDGGGIYRTSGTVTLRNSIVAGNQDASPSGPAAPDCSGTVASAGHNLLGRSDGCTFTATTGDQVGTAGSPINPQLGPLADNGGTTHTHALAPTSPAVDAGAACEAADQRGLPRTGICDIGAYELVTCKTAVVNRIGTEGAEKLVGTSGADGFLAFGGNDKVKGLGGKDTACLGPGKDIGAGGGGKDRLFGEQGKDRLKGQGGNDRLVGGPGKDTCVGGPGKKDRANCEVKKSVP
jgi:CSLREA domain-containing protein